MTTQEKVGMTTRGRWEELVASIQQNSPTGDKCDTWKWRWDATGEYKVAAASYKILSIIG